jgi:hypothetical protein
MNRSESINELAAALSKAQGAMRHAKRDETNPFFKSKYADLASVVEAIKEPLAAHGLAYSQVLDVGEDGVYVETILMHSSGQWISGRLKMPVAKPNDPQALGSASTYCRRFSLQSIIGIPAADDDAEGAMKGMTRTNTKGVPLGPGVHTPSDGVDERLSEPQRIKVQGIVEEMRDACMNEDYIKAAGVFETAGLDPDEAVFAWTFFDAPTRSKLKRAAKAPA